MLLKAQNMPWIYLSEELSTSVHFTAEGALKNVTDSGKGHVHVVLTSDQNTLGEDFTFKIWYLDFITQIWLFDINDLFNVYRFCFFKFARNFPLNLALLHKNSIQRWIFFISGWKKNPSCTLFLFKNVWMK